MRSKDIVPSAVSATTSVWELHHRPGRTAIVVKVCWADVDRLRPDQSAVAKLFQAMCRPAEDASHGKRWREQFGRQSQTVQQQRRIEFDIGIESPFRLALTEQAQRGGFDLPGQLIERPIAVARIEALGGLGEDIRARVTHSVDAMSESHEA